MNKVPLNKQTSLQKHLGEFRARLLKSVLSFVPAFIFTWFYSEQILTFLRKPIKPFLKNTSGGLIFTAPMDQFMAHLQVSMFAAVFLSSPYWLGQFWCFISPGLYKKEKRTFIFFWFMGTMLFFLGALFAYFIVFPTVFSVLMNFGESIDKAYITISYYIDFVIRFTLVLGIVFEMPLFLVFLCRAGIISVQTLKKYRRHAYLILAILAAFITPPDVLSQILLLVPLIILYEFSIWLSAFFKKL